MVIDESVTDVDEGQPTQARDRRVGVDAPGDDVVEELSQRGFVHDAMLPEGPSLAVMATRPISRVGFFGPFDDLVNDRLKQRVVRRGYTLMRRSLTAERRSRSCPRAVRQTVKAWPRLLQTQSVEGPMHFKLA